MRSDTAVQQAVLDELTWDTRVDETEVGVEVDHGVVTLTGTVAAYAKKLAAEEAAHRVPGVLDVANDIKVHVPGGFYQTDTEIAQAVRRALEADVFVPAEGIETTVSDGWVKLEGTVEYWSQRQDAEQAIIRLLGVRGVTNAIEVHTRPVDAVKVQAAIEEALERRAEREAERIEVLVRDGVVTLSGPVRSWREKRAVVGAASHAPGVRSLVDYLRIDPFA
jgi:osmotically-inducible protein OsmY